LQDTILRIEHVRKHYPGVRALNDVSFDIKRGEVHALCGENGAGKSTLIKCIMGVERHDQGSILMEYTALGLKTAARWKPRPGAYSPITKA